MNGFSQHRILARVTNVANGVVQKTGKKWCRFNCVVRKWNFATKKYESEFYNVVGYDFAAEKMQEVEKDTLVYCEGELKIGKPFKTNSGEDVQPFDILVRNWWPAGKFVFEARQEQTTETAEENPFG